MNSYKFDKGAAIVFGGSGVLGSGIVKLLSKNGIDVAFNYFENKKSADELTKIVKSNGKNAFVEKVNLLNLNNVKDFTESAKRKFGRIHSVIDASGPFINIAPISCIVI